MRSALPARTLTVEPLEVRRMLSLSMVMNFNTGPAGAFGASGDAPVAFAGSAYFIADQPETGSELWKSDGTAAGTSIVKELAPGPDSSNFSTPVSMGGSLFLTRSTATGTQLWKSDGSAAGTVLVKDLSPAAPKIVAAGDGSIWLVETHVTNSQTTGYTLWTSDGTADGTHVVTDIAVKPSGFTPVPAYAVVNGKLVFSVKSSTSGSVLWLSDGTASGTAATNVMSPTDFTVDGGSAFFDSNGSLWKTDGTPSGTTVVKQFTPPSMLSPMVVAGGKVYFERGGQDGIWTSDGTSSGTEELAPVPGNGFSFPGAIGATVGGTVYFSANSQHELWKTDGTPAGTSMVASFAGGGVGNFSRFGNRLLFTADDGTSGRELWVTDGTATGTTQVKDISAGAGSLSPSAPVVIGARAVFKASDSIHGTQLWTTDGTEAGTHLVRNLGTATNGNIFSDSATVGAGALDLAVGTALYFTTGSGALFRTDGTATGTAQLTDVRATDLTAVGNLVYFLGYDENTRQTWLWKSDGTPVGTAAVAPAASSSQLAVLGNDVIFNTGTALFDSDGTAGGTHVIVDEAKTGAGADGMVFGPATFSGAVYFLVYAEPPGSFDPVGSLWRTDGTPQGTVKVADGLGLASGLRSIGARLYFRSNAPNAAAPQLWTSDGTAAGTLPLKEIAASLSSGPSQPAAIGDEVFFNTNQGLWKTDGTPAGTVPVVASDGTPLPSGEQMTVFDGHVYLDTAGSTPGTLGLWKTDGTPAGTELVIDPFRSASDDEPISLAVVNGILYLSANLDPVKVGAELYRLDGQTNALTLVRDVRPGAFGSFPHDLIAAGNVLYFAANDGFHGRQLWKLDDVPDSVVGRVFNDWNHNGVAEANEPGLAGVTVYLDLNGNGLPDPAEPASVTNISGGYVFAGLEPGVYTAREVLPTGFRATTALAGQVQVSANATATGPILGQSEVDTVPLDFSYLLVLAQHYGSAGTFATGDINADERVDFADLLILAQNYGKPLPAMAVTMRQRWTTAR
jgi:ELWxxDGT repeat protein